MEFSREFRVVVIKDGKQTIGMVTDCEEPARAPRPMDITMFPFLTGIELTDGEKFSVITTQNNDGENGFRSGKIEFIPLTDQLPQ